ncbi:MAG TPA: hypothetical protein VLE99_03360 [Candidatus Saccharimonadales bacterium]|nr:hypothetical protein [Candidatus Saccharimonadales bacterium]
MSEALLVPERTPQDRLYDLTSQLDALVLRGCSANPYFYSLVQEFVDPDNVVRRRELSWLPPANGLPLRSQLLLTVADAGVEHSYVWNRRGQVQYYPAGQDDIPEENGPDRAEEMATLLESVVDNFTNYPTYNSVGHSTVVPLPAFTN